MSAREPALPMSIWVTGEPVPEARRKRGSFADMIRAATGESWNGPWSVLSCAEDGAVFPEPGLVGGIIVTGSPARIADQSAWMLRVQGALAALVALQVPVLGICFGHQLLGMALGGRSGPNPHGREIGTVDFSLHRGDDLLGTPRSFPVSMTHLDVVLELPPGAAALGASSLDPSAAVRFGAEAWGVQFHPEMDGEILRMYVAALREKLVAEDLDADRVLADCRDTPESAALLRRFARHVAARQQA